MGAASGESRRSSSPEFHCLGGELCLPHRMGNCVPKERRDGSRPLDAFPALPVLTILDEDRSKANRARQVYEESKSAPYEMGKIPENGKEELRHATFRLLRLARSSEPAYDAVIDLCRKLLPYPIILISFVDDDMLWFKAEYGYGAREAPRDMSFCGHLIYSEEPLIVLDATRDPRFARSPHVCGPAHVRFYAGFPIMCNNAALGSLCFLDVVPHDELTPETVSIMARLTSVVESMLAEQLAKRLLEAKLCFMQSTALRNVPPGLAERWMVALGPATSSGEQVSSIGEQPVVLDPFFFTARDVGVVAITYSREMGQSMSLALIARIHALADAIAEATAVTLSSSADGTLVGCSNLVHNTRREVGVDGMTSGPVDGGSLPGSPEALAAVNGVLGYAVTFIRHAQKLAKSHRQGPLTIRASVSFGSIFAGATSGPRLCMYGEPVSAAVASLSKASDGAVLVTPSAGPAAVALVSKVTKHRKLDGTSLVTTSFINVSHIGSYPGSRVESRVDYLMSLVPRGLSGHEVDASSEFVRECALASHPAHGSTSSLDRCKGVPSSTASVASTRESQCKIPTRAITSSHSLDKPRSRAYITPEYAGSAAVASAVGLR